MNQNQLPYGQQLPLPPTPRRHDSSYAAIPPLHLRPHASYAPYYTQHMAPMMPQYPPPFPQNWYPYQQQQQPQHPLPRPYYTQSAIPAQPYQHPHPHAHHPPIPGAAEPLYHPSAPHTPEVPSSSLPPSVHRVAVPPPLPRQQQQQQQQQQHLSPRPGQTAQAFSQPKPVISSASTTSAAPIQTPPSPPLSTSTPVSVQKESGGHSESPTPASTLAPAPTPAPVENSPLQPIVETRPFVAPTPWLSFEGDAFPPRAPPRRRRILRSTLANAPVEFPTPEPQQLPQSEAEQEQTPQEQAGQEQSGQEQAGQEQAEQEQAEQEQAEPSGIGTAQPGSAQSATPLASDVPSESASTQPTTPISSLPTTAAAAAASAAATAAAATAAAAEAAKSQQTPTQAKTKPVAPVVPVVPLLAQAPIALTRRVRDSSAPSQQPAPSTVTSSAPETTTPKLRQAEEDGSGDGSDESVKAPQPAAHEAPTTTPAPSRPKPTSWANLFRPPPQAATASAVATRSTSAPLTVSNVNGVATAAKAETLTEVLNDMHVPDQGPRRLAFLQPRGLVNTGNMCYMNSVLQVLVFCTPFYDFLSKIARRAAHTFKSDTPLIDAIILLMQEYRVLQSAPSAEQLCQTLKPDDYEKYGDSFVPEYVYSAISPLPRFRDMRRGHQQDAQEFLGLLLEELHEECSRAMKSATCASSGRTTPVASAPSVHDQAGVENRNNNNNNNNNGGGGGDDDGDRHGGWMEVGHKQKPAVTRSSGTTAADSPITNIFGGKLRSELKVAGNKLSVTLEPYSPLQLDIGSPEVSNIIDALKGLTKPESMQGDFHTSRGHKSTATKQVFIETLPPVLILHLKRFQYDHTTKRAEKIWKKVGYPLDLEIPKEVFPITLRNKLAAHGALPRYRLTAVIYHHGKNANGGHYTVDIRRQDGKEWIRLDDTVIRRVRSEEVAQAGSEEDPKVLAAALQRHNQAKNPSNRFEQIDQHADDDDDDDDDANPLSRAWNHVNGHSRSKSTASAVVNGAAATPPTARDKLSLKDNKVAYLLFYQRV